MLLYLLFFFFNDTATTEIYTLSLHDALPISRPPAGGSPTARKNAATARNQRQSVGASYDARRSEEHTSELQSRQYLVCRLLLEKKKKPAFPAIYDANDTYVVNEVDDSA